jgi:hypothetical protein
VRFSHLGIQLSQFIVITYIVVMAFGAGAVWVAKKLTRCMWMGVVRLAPNLCSVKRLFKMIS